jgi:hypothetical protein
MNTLFVGNTLPVDCDERAVFPTVVGSFFLVLTLIVSLGSSAVFGVMFSAKQVFTFSVLGFTSARAHIFTHVFRATIRTIL